jgi:hypothetical protein
MTVSKTIPIAAVLALFAVSELGFQLQIFAGPAEAKVGRPLSPVSVAGVARRTTRRTLRRTAIVVAALPPNCVYGAYYGYNLYRCGNSYYEQSGNTYIQVNIN